VFLAPLLVCHLVAIGCELFCWLKQLSVRKDVAKGGGWVLLPVLYFPFVSPFAEDIYVFFFGCCRNCVVVMREFLVWSWHEVHGAGMG
jgi:hypothetical protein